jgi:hypothetical protein
VDRGHHTLRRAPLSVHHTYHRSWHKTARASGCFELPVAALARVPYIASEAGAGPRPHVTCAMSTTWHNRVAPTPSILRASVGREGTVGTALTQARTRSVHTLLSVLADLVATL